MQEGKVISIKNGDPFAKEKQMIRKGMDPIIAALSHYDYRDDAHCKEVIDFAIDLYARFRATMPNNLIVCNTVLHFSLQKIKQNDGKSN